MLKNVVKSPLTTIGALITIILVSLTAFGVIDLDLSSQIQEVTDSTLETIESQQGNVWGILSVSLISIGQLIALIAIDPNRKKT